MAGHMAVGVDETDGERPEIACLGEGCFEEPDMQNLDAFIADGMLCLQGTQAENLVIKLTQDTLRVTFYYATDF